MKVLLVVGDRADSASVAADLVRDLAEFGWEADMLGATRGTGEPRIESGANNTNGGIRSTLVRTDPAPRHWQRTRSISAARLVREHARATDVDLVHVLSWSGTSHDLVASCARIGIPCVVTLADAWYGCLVADRIHRPSRNACKEPLGPAACLGCAEIEFGETPWVPIDARYMAVAERRRDVLRELLLARRVIVPDRSHVEAARHALSDTLLDVAFDVVSDPRDARAHAAIYTAIYTAIHTAIHTAALSSPSRIAAEKAPEWWVERMQVEAECAWDDANLRGPGCDR